MKKRKRPFALLAFAAAVCLAFTACGSDDDDDDEDESEEKKPKVSITVSDDESDPDEGSEQDDSSKEISPDSGNGTESLADTQQDSQPDESKEESIPDQSAPDSSAPDSVPDIPQGVAITDKDIIGTWTAIEINSSGNVTKPMEGVVNGYFYDDYTGGLENTNDDEWEDFEWKISGTTITLDQDGDAVSGSVKADGTMVIGNDRSVITFKKLGSNVKKKGESGGDSSTPDKPSVPSKGDKLSESAVIGQWESTAFFTDGKLYHTDDPSYGEIIVELLKMDIQSGGKGTVSSAGDSEDLEWSIKDDKLGLTVDDDTIYAILSDGQLLIDLDEDGSQIIYLDKVK